jgi:hypothetical protein
MTDIQKTPLIVLAGGRIRCRRCQALSKRSKEQCRKPALKGKSVCGFHGGKSTGPRTEEGRARIAKAHTVHGTETRQMRTQRSQDDAYLRQLEDLLYATGMCTGPRWRGRKPKGYAPITTPDEALLWLARGVGIQTKSKCKK